MKILVFFIGLSFGFFFVNPGQAQIDSLTNKPNIKINVNVQRDENGNIVGYDSSYVETWSSDGGNINVDSLMQSFNNRFKAFGFDDFGDIDIPGFSDKSFFNDSIMTVPFPDFFSFPDFPDMEKMNKEIMEEMKRMRDYFGMPSVPVLPPQDNRKVKKEKTSFQTTKI